MVHLQHNTILRVTSHSLVNQYNARTPSFTPHWIIFTKTQPSNIIGAGFLLHGCPSCHQPMVSQPGMYQIFYSYSIRHQIVEKCTICSTHSLMTESCCIMRVLHVYDLRSYPFPANNYSFSYLAEYCSELFGIRLHTENPYSVQP